MNAFRKDTSFRRTLKKKNFIHHYTEKKIQHEGTLLITTTNSSINKCILQKFLLDLLSFYSKNEIILIKNSRLGDRQNK